MPRRSTVGHCKLFPSGGGVQAWVDRRGKTHPEGYAFCPSQEGIFRGTVKYGARAHRLQITRNG